MKLNAADKKACKKCLKVRGYCMLVLGGVEDTCGLLEIAREMREASLKTTS